MFNRPQSQTRLPSAQLMTAQRAQPPSLPILLSVRAHNPCPVATVEEVCSCSFISY